MSHSPVVFVHAHPDDEANSTGGTIGLLARAGIAVSVVIATTARAAASPRPTTTAGAR